MEHYTKIRHLPFTKFLKKKEGRKEKKKIKLKLKGKTVYS